MLLLKKIFRKHGKYTVYRWDKTPNELGDKAEYYAASSQKEAIELTKKLNNRRGQKNKWVWA